MVLHSINISKLKRNLRTLTSEEFFEIIRDGAWHNLNDLAVLLKLPIEKLLIFSDSLSKQGIISYQKKTPKIKIRSEWKAIFYDEPINKTN